MDLRIRPQLLSSYIAPIERRGCHRSKRFMRWLSQQLGDVADKANGQVLMPYSCGHVQAKVKRRCRVNTPLNNPGPLAEDDVTDIEVTDPTHPLFGRRFPILSARPQAPLATHVFVTYQGFMVLRLPRTATNLFPQAPRLSTTLTSHAITDLIALAEQCEVLCRTIPE